MCVQKAAAGQICMDVCVHGLMHFCIHMYTCCGIAFKRFIDSFMEQILPSVPHVHLFKITA